MKSEASHPDLGKPLGEVLLEPTKIYAAAAGALRGKSGVHAIAHITGGGLPGNAGRILPPGLQARFRPGDWSEPKIFDLIARHGPVERAEMFKTFNMGLGLVVAVDPAEIEAVELALAEAGESPCRVGEAVKREKGGHAVLLEGVAL